MDTPKGPVMLCATEILRPPPARVGSIGGGITLPRTVPLKGLIAAVSGAFVGLLLTVWSGNIRVISVGIAVFGSLAVMSTNVSPLPGESLFTWAALTVTRRRTAIRIDGAPVRVAIGIMPVDRVAQGHVDLAAAAVPVQPGTVDERGVLRSARNRNVPPLGQQ